MQNFPNKADSDGQLIAKVLVCARILWAAVGISSTWFHTVDVWVQEEDTVSRSGVVVALFPGVRIHYGIVLEGTPGTCCSAHVLDLPEILVK